MSFRAFIALVPILLTLWSSQGVTAQRTLSEASQISLITIMPGHEIYSIFGHSAIRVRDPIYGIDQIYNYGTFDFSDPLRFSATFLYGELDYALSVNTSFSRMVDYYWNVERRAIIEQVINLNKEQRVQIFQFLEFNARPENRYYRYDFFFDNCSTRIRDVFERVLGTSLVFTEVSHATTFRHLLDPYLVEAPFLDLGMDLSLGARADRIASMREQMFLPRHLMLGFEYATLSVSGRQQSLIARTDTITWSPDSTTLFYARPWPAYLFWGLFVLGVLLVLYESYTGQAAHRLLDILLFGLAGIAGLAIAFLWFFSLHTVTQPNLNLFFWAWPTHLVAMIPLFQAKKKKSRRWKIYFAASALAAIIGLLGWTSWPQELPDAVLPLLLLMFIRSTSLAIQFRL